MDWSALKSRLLERGGAGRLPDVRLPVLPEAALSFLRESGAPNVDLGRLATILASDAGLSARLLRFVNSGAVGLSRTVDSVPRAVGLLGLKPSRAFVSVAAAEAATAALKSSIFHGPTLAATNLRRGLFARELASRLGVDDGLAFSAGLLQDVLLPVIAEERVEAYLAMLSPHSEGTLPEAEHRDLGWNHAEAGGALLLKWGLPDSVACCVWLHHDAEAVLADAELFATAAFPVALSALVPDGYRQADNGLRRLLAYEDREPRLDLDASAAAADALAEAMLPPSAPKSSLAQQIAAAREQRTVRRGTEGQSGFMAAVRLPGGPSVSCAAS